MRIISKHRDYYDNIKAYGIDPHSVYIRKEEADIEFKDINFNIESVLYTEKKKWGLFDNTFPYGVGGGKQYKGDNGFGWKLYIIGFCGRLYPCIHLSYKTTDNYYPYTEHEHEVYVYNEADILKFLTTHEIKDEIRDYNDTQNRYNDFNKVNIRNMFSFIEGKNRDIVDLFHERRIPVFVIDVRKKRLTWNPVLENYQFYRAVDTFTAFQELSGYVSGVLGGQSPKIVKISDKDMVFKKGFDNMSFRKAPTKKR